MPVSGQRDRHPGREALTLSWSPAWPSSGKHSWSAVLGTGRENEDKYGVSMKSFRNASVGTKLYILN